jgi:hypothetical protein
MLRPPSSGGGRESDFNDYDDAEIPAKRGRLDDLDQHPDSRPSEVPTGSDPAPGHGDDLPERLGERIENGSSSSIATGGADVLPDVEVPDTTM